VGVVANGDNVAPFAFSPIIAGGVLQHGEPTAVWGQGAKAGATVVVTLHTSPPQTVDTAADQSGDWSVKLPSQPVSWSVMMSAASGATSPQGASTTVSFGTVVLCAGQSNSE
jgi:hypothetical protein